MKIRIFHPLLCILIFLPLAGCEDLPAARGLCRPAPAFTAPPLNTCPGPRRLRLTIAGDVLLHWQLQQIGYRSGLAPVWQRAVPYFDWADIAIANLEGPVARGVNTALQQVPDPGPVLHRGVYTGYPRFNYHPVILPQLAALGVDMVTTANNHAMDRGRLGADLTLAALARAGIAAIGSRPSDSSAPFVRYRDTRLGRIALIACSYDTNGIADTHGQVLLCYRQRSTLLALVREAALTPDIAAVIVLPHWGQEYSSTPDQAQRQLARQLAEAGASAIIGTHPHAVQPVELLPGAGGQIVPVFYATGNFVAVQSFMPARVGALAVLELCDGGGGRAVVGNFGWIATEMVLTQEAFYLDVPPQGAAGARGLAERHLTRIAPGFSAQPPACPPPQEAH